MLGRRRYHVTINEKSTHISQEIIKSHRLILAAQSKFFEGFFRRESKDTIMLDFKKEYVRICIAYMVNGEVNLNIETEELEGVLEVGFMQFAFFFSKPTYFVIVSSFYSLPGGQLPWHGLLG